MGIYVGASTSFGNSKFPIMNSIRCTFKILLLPFVTLLIGGCRPVSGPEAVSARIQPYTNNPSYWQYKNQPLLLLGGSSDDNIFQHLPPDLDLELDRLVAHGGNYLRCTMSSRDSGNVQAFHFDTLSGKYDLDRWNEAYWQRFDYFLKATQARNIIVQVEIWATYDFYTRGSHTREGLTAWDRNPWNPGNNINYTEEQSGLSGIFRSNGYQLINPFFNTVLPLREPFDFETRPVVLGYQQKFVNRLLSLAFACDHLLYVIDNETNADPAWPRYWSQYLQTRAAGQQKSIEITEMWDTFDPTGGAVAEAAVQDIATHFFTRRSGVSNTLSDPDNYTYLDISNHNYQWGDTHYKTGLYVWNEVQKSGLVRPVNNTKIYGSDESGWAGPTREGLERFWRNIFAGAASVRFHRPPSGLGHLDIAMQHIRSMRMLTDSIDLFSSRPSNHLLRERSENEAYLLAGQAGDHALFFPDGGEVRVEIHAGDYSLRWLDIGTSTWLEPVSVRFPGLLTVPDTGMWAARISPDS